MSDNRYGRFDMPMARWTNNAQGTLTQHRLLSEFRHTRRYSASFKAAYWFLKRITVIGPVGRLP